MDSLKQQMVAIGKIQRALEGLSNQDRKLVLSFVSKAIDDIETHPEVDQKPTETYL